MAGKNLPLELGSQTVEESKMTRRFTLLLLSLFVVFVVAVPAFPSTVLITFVQANANDQTFNGDYAGLYDGKVNGVKTEFVCDDFLHNISGGESWTANVNSSAPVNPDPTTGNRFGPGTINNPLLTVLNLTQQEEYNMITWLVEQIFADPSNSNHQWGAYQGAIWAITDSAWQDGDYTASYGGLTAKGEVIAAEAYKDVPAARIVYTPAEGQPGQEFYGTEPAIPVLLGFTFVGVGMLRKRLSA